MEIKQLKQVEVVTDVVCDVCNQSTKLEFGTLWAHWGYGSKHDGGKDMNCSYVKNVSFMP